MAIVRVGAVQTGPVLVDDPRPQIPLVRRWFEQAAQQEVRLLCFSEVFLAPFFPNRLVKNFDCFFLDSGSEEIASLAALSKEFGIAAILPFAERTPSSYYNAALVVDAEGRRVGTYRKTHIPAYFPTESPGGTGSFEKLYFAPGADLPVFDVAGLRFGIQICNDRLYPEPSRVLAIAGAEVIFMPICYSTYADPQHRSSIWEVPLRARAYENGIWVVAANRVGLEGPRNHLGRSLVVDPRGGIVADAGSDGEALLVHDLDLDAVTRARKDFPWWRDRRPDLYAPLAR